MKFVAEIKRVYRQTIEVEVSDKLDPEEAAEEAARQAWNCADYMPIEDFNQQSSFVKSLTPVTEEVCCG